MKALIIGTVLAALALLPLVPATTTITYTTKVPEEYTVTETYTELVPRVGERAVYHEAPARTEWRRSIKTSIEDAIPPVTSPSYYTIEQFSYTKSVRRERLVTRIRLVDKIISTNITEHISVVEWIVRR